MSEIKEISSVLALITARGGSRRIPRKNIRLFHGKPMIAYAIAAAKGAGCFDEVMVSTDDDEIADIAEGCGASVPFKRSAASSDDYATTDDVIAEVLATYEREGRHFDAFCCIYPTAVFLTPDRLREAVSALRIHESVMPVVQFSYPPQRGFLINGIREERRLIRQYPEYALTRSQDLTPVYHDAGQFYACRTEAFLRGRTTDVEDLFPLILKESETQDIDTEEDFAIARIKYEQWKMTTPL